MSTRINTSLTRVSTNQHESTWVRHESNTSQHESTQVQNRFKSDSPKIYDQGILLFPKGIYCIKHCSIIYFIYFQERSSVKSIPKTIETSIKTIDSWNKKWVEFQRKQLKTKHCLILYWQVEAFLHVTFANKKFHKFKKSQNLLFPEQRLSRIEQKRVFQDHILLQMSRVTWLKFFCALIIAKRTKTNSHLHIPKYMLLRSAEVQKLLRWLSIKANFITSNKDKNFLSSKIDAKYRSRNLIMTPQGYFRY